MTANSFRGQLIDIPLGNTIEGVEESPSTVNIADSLRKCDITKKRKNANECLIWTWAQKERNIRDHKR
ncbi:hypothetical protein PISMIDRAFT_447873 [Pisolithus microcarpus 441]|uniref:Uncharacterized protein n=1 Tax=Pisolithus microcarpus 441 TaxID=765257 RepID=A0A0C9ZKV6_9AGAM|nr:hypothetical protein PISMIDRAFT_447873 [Pisolithus microcarpus 441]